MAVLKENRKWIQNLLPLDHNFSQPCDQDFNIMKLDTAMTIINSKATRPGDIHICFFKHLLTHYKHKSILAFNQMHRNSKFPESS